MSSYVGTFQSGTSATAVSVTGVGFTPQLILFWSMSQASTFPLTVGNRNNHWFFGAADENGNDYCVEGRHNNGATAVSGVVRNDHSISFTLLDAGTATLTSMDAGGFTVTFDEAPDADRTIMFMALAGADLTNVNIVPVSYDGTNPTAVTGVGFQPDCVMLVGGGPADFGSNYGLTQIMFSVATSAADADTIGMAYKRDDDIIEVAAGIQETDEGSGESINFYEDDGNGSPQVNGQWASFDADGFTIGGSSTSGTHRMFAICFKGGSYFVDEVTTPTSTGEEAITGVGFQPDALLTFTRGRGDTGSDNDCAFAFGAASAAGEEATYGWHHEDSGSDQEVTIANATNFLSILDPTADSSSSVVEESSFVSFDTDGWTWDWTTATASSRRLSVFAMALGVAASSPFGSGIIFADGLAT